MKYIKTYGIYGLLEWHGVVKAGSATMKVSFTNGTTTAYGVSPATYITKDEATQFVIENSDKFKSGRIKLISKRELPFEGGNEPEQHTAAKPAEPAADAPEAPAGSTMSFANIEDAKDYFSEKYDVNRSKMRSRAAVEEVAKGYGITISWND